MKSARKTARSGEFGARFREAVADRKWADLSEAALGKQLGCDQSTAHRWATGAATPSIRTAVRVSEALGVCVEWLLTGRGPKRPADRPDLPPDVQRLVQYFGLMDPKRREQCLEHARFLVRDIEPTSSPVK